MNPQVDAFFDEGTNTVTYVVSDPDTRACAVIDPVLDYEASSGRTTTRSADRIIGHVSDAGLSVTWILETHVHADHLTSAPYLRDRLGGRIGISSGVLSVQRHFKSVFNAEAGFEPDGSQFDHLFADEERFGVGSLEGEVLHTPGHTPACAVFHIGDAVFVGDTLFMPDSGTARCDFPDGDAATLYRSIRRILDLPPETRLFVCHDYGCGGKRGYAWETTVAEERESNIHVRDGVDEAEYVRMRTDRDAQLAYPALMLPAVQVNMRAGRFPPAEENGTAYIKIPLNAV